MECNHRWLCIQNDEIGIFLQYPHCEQVRDYQGIIISEDGPWIDMEEL